MAAVLVAPAAGRACDMCAVYLATEGQVTRTGFRLGVATQYTAFHALQDAGRSAPNPDGEFVESTITQFVVGYVPVPRAGVQVNIPFIYRGFRRATAAGPVNGHVTGAGDVALVGHLLLLEHLDIATIGHLMLYGGVKLPSGNTEQLRDEGPPAPDPCAGIPPDFCTARRPSPRHANPAVPSGVHGHDLSLGTGSVDALVGANALGVFGRWYATGHAQYIVRTPGAAAYRYANELSLSGGPGAFLAAGHRASLGLQALIGCDTKGNDTQAGVTQGDTALTALYAGPALRATVGRSLSLEVAADLPLVRNNAGLQLVPSYRVRGALMLRF